MAEGVVDVNENDFFFSELTRQGDFCQGRLAKLHPHLGKLYGNPEETRELHTRSDQQICKAARE